MAQRNEQPPIRATIMVHIENAAGDKFMEPSRLAEELQAQRGRVS